MGPIWTRRQMLGASLAAGAGLVLGGCTTREAKKIGGRIRRPATSATLRIGALGKRSALRRDPHGPVFNDSDLLILSLIYDPLTIPGPARPVSGRLASRWESSLDLKEWRFHLAEGATFHDGSPVTSADVVWSLERLLSRPDNRRLSGIEIGGIDTDGKGAVMIEATRRNGEVPELLRTFTFTVPEGTDDAVGAPGTGPFELDAYDDGDARLVRNDAWYGGEPAVAAIEVTRFEDPDALAAAVVDGEIDVASNVGADAAQVATGHDDLRVLRRTHDVALPLVMRVADGPFADVRVRQAVSRSLDRRALVDQVFDGAGRVGNDILGTADPLYAEDLPQLDRDLDEADRLLIEAGFDRSVEHRLYVSETVPHATVAAGAIAAQLAEVGLAIVVTEQPADVFDAETRGRAPLYLTSTHVNDSLAVSASNRLRSDGRGNETGFADPEFDRVLDAALKEFDGDKRRRFYREVQEIQRARGGYVVWGVGDGVDLLSKEVLDVPRSGGYGRYALEATWMAR